MAEIDPLVFSFSHLAKFPREAEALQILKKVASLVKPMMRARGWKVGQLTEFYPEQHNLLGLNIGRGQRICLRLRYHSDCNQFVPIEQVIDTMLHELAHNVHGPHDEKFHALWNQLREEHESLIMKGYTGEGFLSAGHRLGGRKIPMDEARRLARASAEKRRTLNTGSGQRLGGAAPGPSQDIRRVIVGAVERRNNSLRGCANDNRPQNEIQQIADTATKNGFRTQAEEDAANDAAIAQALWELVQEEEMAKKGKNYVPPSSSIQTWDHGGGSSSNSAPGPSRPSGQSRKPEKSVNRGDGRSTWTCDICTLVNPTSFLCCDACGTERGEKITQNLAGRSTKGRPTVIDLTQSPSANKRNASTSKSTSRPIAGPAIPHSTKPPAPTWTCSFCGRVRDKQWWSCDLCGTVKHKS
ncbi:WLM-domain-containing protein [Annulohypoxylon maeteangense]|uniref:WLM-domain-containing protein n=1 Tax=Annulohypoxylon maeteangense TaxID=1927788 RepID=UPI0020085797|nr:WLM-domain-containing protein [Annulohypoxylon maeteangense]KAI0881640.1 WLM-domain-containing protein [Annulohypoxylon maeteangense]